VKKKKGMVKGPERRRRGEKGRRELREPEGRKKQKGAGNASGPKKMKV